RVTSPAFLFTSRSVGHRIHPSDIDCPTKETRPSWPINLYDSHLELQNGFCCCSACLFFVVENTFDLITTWRVEKKKTRVRKIISLVLSSTLFAMLIRYIIRGEH